MENPGQGGGKRQFAGEFGIENFTGDGDAGDGGVGGGDAEGEDDGERETTISW